MKVKSTLSSGEIFMHEDGTFEVAPFQVFRSASGGTCIRIGRNCFYFRKDGTYDGPECKPTSATDVEELQAALRQCKSNRGQRPDEPYFQPNSDGFMAEVKAWPSEGQVPEQPDDLHVYGYAPDKKPSN